MGPLVFVVGSLGFEPRIANAPGWYPKPSAVNVAQDTLQLTNARRRPQQPTKYQAEIINTLIKVTNEGKTQKTIQCFASSLKHISLNADMKNPESVEAHISSLQQNSQTKTDTHQPTVGIYFFRKPCSK